MAGVERITRHSLLSLTVHSKQSRNHIGDAGLLQGWQQGVQLAQLVAAQDGVQEVVLDDLECAAWARAAHCPHLADQHSMAAQTIPKNTR